MNFQPNSIQKCVWNKQNIIYIGMKCHEIWYIFLIKSHI